MRNDICTQAAIFLSEHEFTAPPLLPDQALEARKLEITQLSLDDLLVKANLPPENHKRIQAMLDTSERAVTFRSDLPIQQRNWGALHEIGHEFLPWQRQLLYFCPLLLLPTHVQEQFEMEADIFASEAFFFGDRFSKYRAQGDWGLTTAIDLAENVFGTSLHATFRHYVESSKKACCLLVWRPTPSNGDLWTPGTDTMSLHYYIKSPTFRGHIDPGQIADSDDIINKVYCESPDKVVKHQMKFRSQTNETFVADGESFSNSYTVFTLISQPQLRKQLTST
jgi:hypothetical protein